MYLCAAAILSLGTAYAQVPTYSDFQLYDLQNRPVKISTLLKKGPVLLDFWATWCSPCLKSMPKLEALHKRYESEGLSIIGINEDGPRSRAKIRPFLHGRRITFPHLIDGNGEVMRLYRVTGLPTSILIAPDGKIVRRRLAAEASNIEALETEIITLLGLFSDAP